MSKLCVRKAPLILCGKELIQIKVWVDCEPTQGRGVVKNPCHSAVYAPEYNEDAVICSVIDNIWAQFAQEFAYLDDDGERLYTDPVRFRSAVFAAMPDKYNGSVGMGIPTGAKWVDLYSDQRRDPGF